MEERFLLSFIIPVYNVEPYLDECAGSILSQAGGQCEIILVDDGSTDRSGGICDRYGAEYDFVTVLHKPNGGLSSARNAGLALARGRYIAFIDSDDRVAEGSVDRLLTWIRASEADICFLDAVKFFRDGSRQPLGDRIDPAMIQGRSRDVVFAHLASRPKYPGSACTKIYRAQYLSRNHLRFPDGRRHGEDLSFVRDCLLAAETFDALPEPYYEYRQNRAGSITDRISAGSFFDLALFVRETAEKTSTGKKPKDGVCGCALSFAAYEYSILLWQYGRLAREERAEAEKFLEEYRRVLRYGRTRRLLMVRAARKILGLGGSARLLDLYMSHRRENAHEGCGHHPPPRI